MILSEETIEFFIRSGKLRKSSTSMSSLFTLKNCMTIISDNKFHLGIYYEKKPASLQKIYHDLITMHSEVLT